MKKRKYKKPFMATEEFDPNFCTTPCDNEKLEVIFNNPSFIKHLFCDANNFGQYDSGEQVVDYRNTPIPTSIIMDPSENDEKTEGFYNVQNGEFINIATYMDYYKNSSYSQNSRLHFVYGIKSVEGNYYYFNSMPKTRALPHS